MTSTSTSTFVVLATFIVALGAGASTFRVVAQTPEQTVPQGAPQPPTVVPPPPVQTQSPPQTPAQPPPPTPSPSGAATDTDHGTALMLLDRVATVLDTAVNGKKTKTGAVGTSGSEEGEMKVVMDRAALDEIRAEITQIKLLLNSEPAKSSVALRPR